MSTQCCLITSCRATQPLNKIAVKYKIKQNDKKRQENKQDRREQSIELNKIKKGEAKRSKEQSTLAMSSRCRGGSSNGDAGN